MASRDGLGLLAALLAGGGARLGGIAIGDGRGGILDLLELGGDDGPQQTKYRGSRLSKALSRGDFSDIEPLSSVDWVELPSKTHKVLVALTPFSFKETVPGDDSDTHLIVLMQEETDPESWIHWS